ncbi:MAG: hypothetical protein ABR575_01640 [Actinomycetota bacterium]
MHLDMRLAATMLVATVALGSATPAAARDHRAPRATLRVRGDVQKGHLHHSDGWARRTKDPRFCEGTFGHGFRAFRKPLRHNPGDEIAVRLHKQARPEEVEVLRWPRVDENGHATGTPTPLPWLLRPLVVQGDIRAWEVVVLPPHVDGHLYLDVGAYWRDEDGCYQEPDLGNQYAAWTFHLRGI